MSGPPLVLASASPRRRRLLEQLGLRFDVVAAHVDETVRADETPREMVRRLALAKARAVADAHPDALVIGGDTEVIFNGAILGKPASGADAVATLLRLQGHEHRVETGVAVVAPGGRYSVDVVGADVRFRTFGRGVAEAYVATGEPMDKAGAYGIQGRGGVLVAAIRGDYFAVMGLPVARVATLVEEVGYRYSFAGEITEVGG
ncbi:MAG: Maf family protein [Gemmatimonadota bacterium]